MNETTLLDFYSDRIAEQKKEKLKKEKIVNYLSKLSAQRLKNDLRKDGGHPKPAWGNGDTWRFHYLEECSRRGLKLLSKLDWPTKDESLYVNIHTGSVETLYDIATMDGYFPDRYSIASEVWSVVEHWEPYDPTRPNCFKIQYLENEIKHLKNEIPNNNNRSTIKYDKARLNEILVTLAGEKKKLFPDPDGTLTSTNKSRDKVVEI